MFLNWLKKKDRGSRNAMITSYSAEWCHFLDPGHQFYPPSHLHCHCACKDSGKRLNNVLVLIWKKCPWNLWKDLGTMRRFVQDFWDVCIRGLIFISDFIYLFSVSLELYFLGKTFQSTCKITFQKWSYKTIFWSQYFYSAVPIPSTGWHHTSGIYQPFLKLKTRLLIKEFLLELLVNISVP